MGKKATWLSAVKRAFSPSKESSSAVDQQQEQHKDTDTNNLFFKDGRKEMTTTYETRRPFKEKSYRWSFSRSSMALQRAAAADDHELISTVDQPADQDRLPKSACSRKSKAEISAGKSKSPFERSSYGVHCDSHQNKQAMAVAVATAAAAEAAVAAAQAAAQVAKITGQGACGAGRSGRATPRSSNFGRQSRKELAAILIQAVFRGYLARREFRTLKGMARLQALAQGRVGQRQTTATMRCMQALVRAQAAVRGRRTTRLYHDELAEGASMQQLRMHPRAWAQDHPNDVVGKARQDIHKGDQSGLIMAHHLVPEWDDSTQTIEETQARERSKQEAAVKRERSMAYAFSHQQLNGGNYYSDKMSQSVPQNIGWNWLERWMAARRPWENRRPSPATNTKDIQVGLTLGVQPIPGTPPRPCPRRGSAPTTPSAWKHESMMTPRRTASPTRRRPTAVTPILATSFVSAQCIPASSARAHSLASSSLRDDLSVASFSGTPSYMATTESARAKLRSHSTPKQHPRAAVRMSRCAATSVHSEDNKHLQSPQYGSVREAAARKRLSFPSNAPDSTGSARNRFSWRSTAPLRRNFSFEGYTKTKF